jgi:quinol monooxygenase YgiN
MLIVQVHVCVKPESAAAFKKATVENARSSIQESGIARFDVLEQQDDATRFVLIEGPTSMGSAIAGSAALQAPHLPMSGRCFAGIRFGFPQDGQFRIMAMVGSCNQCLVNSIS